MTTSDFVLEPEVSYAINSGYFTDEVKKHITSNLSPIFSIRPYQEEAFKRFDIATGNHPKREINRHLLFHMATGSGKTLIMAGLILDLYSKGYRNFIFFVNSTNIIEKTKDNFLNSLSAKYLFNDTITFLDRIVNIKAVDNFEAVHDEDINIVFTTIQGLHSTLNTPRENSLTYEDFEDKKIVLLSDEAHHINAETKKREVQQTLAFEDTSPSWENTVEKIFKANTDNYLLEFTATAELSNEHIRAKYKDKLLFDYPLTQFRIDKYSKEVKVLQADLPPFERALQAVILSQYRQKVFENNQLHIKPVVLLKSKTIKDSGYFYGKFISAISSLTVEQLEKIKRDTSEPTMNKVFSYFEHNKVTLENLVLELQNDFSEDKCIVVDSKHDSEQKQLIVNSLEDEHNEYRAVFAVDKLNEGWDVLNLFDIVRLYDTRDTRGNVGKTTMSEAQLIGRGARYCPFKVTDDQPLYQRKYDDDSEHDLRICEELYYHSAHNPRYISELNKALQEIGIAAQKTVQKTLVLKDTFRKTDSYKHGVVYLNTRRANDRKDIRKLDQSIRAKIYKKKFTTGMASVETLLDNELVLQPNPSNTIHSLCNFSRAIIRKALNTLPFYRFNNLRRYFPHITSMSAFMDDDNYLNNIEIEFIGNAEQVKNPNNQMKLEAAISALEEIAQSIDRGYVEYKGTKEFSPKSIKQVFDNDKNGKILNIAIDTDSDQERGRGQAETPNQDLYLDLSREAWYVYNDNYGTSEEKYLVRYIKSAYESLKEKYEVYLIRNEHHFKIYSFDEGLPFAPDFVLFLVEKRSKQSLVYQIFIEPKGGDRLTNDDSKVKERFLLQIAKEHTIKIVFDAKDYRLVGMPLYNEHKTKRNFDDNFKKVTQNQETSTHNIHTYQ